MTPNGQKLSHGHRRPALGYDDDVQVSWLGQNSMAGGRWLQRCVRPTHLDMMLCQIIRGVRVKRCDMRCPRISQLALILNIRDINSQMCQREIMEVRDVTRINILQTTKIGSRLKL